MLLLIVNRSSEDIDEAAGEKFRKSGKFLRYRESYCKFRQNLPSENFLTTCVDRSTPGDLGWPDKSGNEYALGENPCIHRRSPLGFAPAFAS